MKQTNQRRELDKDGKKHAVGQLIQKKWMRKINIARDTTDPGYCVYNLIIFVTEMNLQPASQGHQMVSLQFWLPDGATCIRLPYWPPGCVVCIATLPWNVLLALSVSIQLVSSSAKVTSVKSAKTSLSLRHSDPQIGPQVYLGPIENAHCSYLRPI